MDFEGRCRWEAARMQVDWVGRHHRIGGESIHYMEAGQGDPLLLVHGFFAWSFTCRKNLPALGERFHTYAVDLRGWGLSQRGSTLAYGLDDQADLLAAFLDAMQIQRAALMGHSMGGEVALRFALRHPDRLKGMVLLSPSALVQRRKRWVERYLLPILAVGPLAVRLAVPNRRFAARSVRQAYHRAEQVTPADIGGYYLPTRLPGSARFLVNVLQDVDFGAAADRLGRVAHRTLLIWGENDPWVPVSHGYSLARQIPQAELVTFPTCGHLPHEESPERFHQVGIPFLQSL